RRRAAAHLHRLRRAMGARAISTRRKPARAAAKALAPEVDAWLKAAALDVADDGIVISDATTPDAPIVYVSPSFERLVGYPAEEILGTNCRMVQGPGTD